MTAPVPKEVAQAARSVYWPIRVTGTESGNFIGYATANDQMRRALRGVMPVVERADDALSTVCLCHPLAFRPSAGHRNFLFCLAPGTRVLTADLRWVAIDDVRAGDALIAPDEDLGPQNRMRRSMVLATSRLRAPRYRIVTDRGEVIASAAHQWVAMPPANGHRRWTRSDALAPGWRIAFYADPWTSDDSYDDGWMAGFLDGEGFVSRHQGAIVGFAQNYGPVLDRALGILARDGFEYAVDPARGGRLAKVRILGAGAMLRALGKYRPTRLLPRANLIWEGRRSWHRGTSRATVLSVEPLGEGEVCGLATTTKTVVAEGMLSHNTMFESTQVPDEFDSAFGRADVLVVPTTFCKRIFRAMPSAPKRIEVCPLGIETDLFRYRRRRPKPGRFRWLMVCAPNPRKWSIFEDAFGYLRQRYGDAVELYVKTTACAVQRGAADMVQAGLGDGFAIERTPAGEIIRGVGRNAGWIIDNRRLPREELAALYYEADGFMALHMGEGFGLTPLEAQATGLPVVVTGATGTDDFCTPETAFRVEAYEGEIPCESRDGHRTMIWGVEPKIESAVSQLVAVMEDPHRAAVVGKRAAENAARFTWQAAAMRLRDIVLRS